MFPVESRSESLGYWQPIYNSQYVDDVPSEFDGRIKRGLDDIEQQLSKRTNLKRLVILSARGFGRKWSEGLDHGGGGDE